MHYLRYSVPETMRRWAELGLDYDSTLGWAELPNFRCGTSHEYGAIDPLGYVPIDLRIRPLIAMEASALSHLYCGLKPVSALEILLRLRNRVQDFGGRFTLLWHNSELRTPQRRWIYERLLALS